MANREKYTRAAIGHMTATTNAKKTKKATITNLEIKTLILLDLS